MNSKLSCIVLDDEPLGREVIESFVKQVPFLKLEASFGDPMETLEYLQKNSVDLIFTDIEMPKINGMELVRSLVNLPVIIFITAHRDFALDGFDTGATDYLVKPVRFERFLKAVNRAKDFIGNKNLKQKAEDMPDRIFIKSDGKLVKILFDEILYVEAQGDYLKVVTQTRTYTTLATLKSMEEVLLLPYFFKIQRSFVINLSSIKAINGNMVELSSGKLISISLNKKEELFELMGLK